MAFLTFAEAKAGSAPPFVFCNAFPNNIRTLGLCNMAITKHLAVIRCHDSYNHKATNLHKLALKLWQGSQNQCSHTKLFRQSGTENVLKPRTPRTCTNLKRPPLREGPNKQYLPGHLSLIHAFFLHQLQTF